MEYCIYHSKDLDGLTSGAVIYSHQKAYGEDCILVPYDFGEKLDTRRFKGKSTIMIDVSMEMDRMEMLSVNAMEFLWLDHHLSAYNKLKKYCLEKNYTVTEIEYNSLITRIEVKEMNLIYFYSSRLSGCEIASTLCAKNLTKNSREVITILGQYDTWRDVEEKKFAYDKNWNEVVMPVQYFMRTCKSPVEVYEVLKLVDSYRDDFELKDIITQGKSIFKYQNNINESQAKKYFEFEFEGLNVIALNTHFFNSNTFEGLYHPDIHDAMMPFVFDGPKGVWVFSLYTTKDDVDLLSVATKFGGGGHAKACGFSIDSSLIEFNGSEITLKKSYILNASAENKDAIIKPEYTKKGYSHYVKDEINYLIPNIMKAKINKDLESLSSLDFAVAYEKYKV
jgi:oligoribonuclease NrnB/cAMP/cGMP phosphodiesterase (DHH superfamily)